MIYINKETEHVYSLLHNDFIDTNGNHAVLLKCLDDNDGERACGDAFSVTHDVFLEKYEKYGLVNKGWLFEVGADYLDDDDRYIGWEGENCCEWLLAYDTVEEKVSIFGTDIWPYKTEISTYQFRQLAEALEVSIKHEEILL